MSPSFPLEKASDKAIPYQFSQVAPFFVPMWTLPIREIAELTQWDLSINHYSEAIPFFLSCSFTK